MEESDRGGHLTSIGTHGCGHPVHLCPQMYPLHAHTHARTHTHTYQKFS